MVFRALLGSDPRPHMVTLAFGCDRSAPGQHELESPKLQN